MHEHERLNLLAAVPDLTIRSLILDLHTRLDEMESERGGIITFVTFAKWMAPLLVAIVALVLRG